MADISSRRRWLAVAALPVVVAAFALAWMFPSFPGDEWALLRFQAMQAPWLTQAALAVTRLGDAPVAAAITLATILALLVLRWRGNAVMVAISGLLVLAGIALKLVVGRVRPDYLLAGEMPHTLSFPSGHALYAAVMGGVLIVLVGEHIRPPLLRRAVQAVLVLLVLAVGASRVYLGVHWPSDVIGSYLFGLVALPGLTWLRKRVLNQ